MGPRFDETPRGRKFYEADLPKLIKAIEANTAELKRANGLKEAEMRMERVRISATPEHYNCDFIPNESRMGE